MTRSFFPNLLAAAALAVLPAATAAQEAAPELSLEQRMLLRCSAAFALVSAGQAKGNAEALRFPRDEAAYREFFVQAAARVMEETGMGRSAIESAMQREAQDLVDNGSVAQVMPACLSLLP